LVVHALELHISISPASVWLITAIVPLKVLPSDIVGHAYPSRALAPAFTAICTELRLVKGVPPQVAENVKELIVGPMPLVTVNGAFAYTVEYVP
jgi:hypothetical protein